MPLQQAGGLAPAALDDDRAGEGRAGRRAQHVGPGGGEQHDGGGRVKVRELQLERLGAPVVAGAVGVAPEGDVVGGQEGGVRACRPGVALAVLRGWGGGVGLEHGEAFNASRVWRFMVLWF